jgi:hypothetical protein
MINKLHKKEIGRFTIDVEIETYNDIKNYCIDNEILLKEWMYDAVHEKYKKDTLQDR